MSTGGNSGNGTPIPVYQQLWEQYLKVVGKTRVNLSLAEILTSFAAEAYAKPYAIVHHYIIPPGVTNTTYASTPEGYVNILSQLRFYVSQDNAIAAEIYIDNYLFSADESMIQNQYNNPYDSITQLVAIIPAKKYVKGIQTNLTTGYVEFSSVISGFLIPSKTWDALEEKYFKAILKYIGVSGNG